MVKALVVKGIVAKENFLDKVSERLSKKRKGIDGFAVALVLLVIVVVVGVVFKDEIKGIFTGSSTKVKTEIDKMLTTGCKFFR